MPITARTASAQLNDKSVPGRRFDDAALLRGRWTVIQHKKIILLSAIILGFMLITGASAFLTDQSAFHHSITAGNVGIEIEIDYGGAG